MTQHVKIFLNGKIEEFTVGSKGIKKIFNDSKDPLTVVILTDDNIVTYTNFPFIMLKDYKEKE